MFIHDVYYDYCYYYTYVIIIINIERARLMSVIYCKSDEL